MLRVNSERIGRLLAVTVLTAMCAGAATAAVGTVPSEAQGVARAAWLLQRESLQSLPLTGELFQSDEFGGGSAVSPSVANTGGGRSGGALPVLASLVLPGAGEAMLGHKRGYLMMALDIFAWTQVAKNHSDGADLRDEYYAFADAHYSDQGLVIAYNGIDDGDGERDGLPAPYLFGVTSVADESELYKLPLYVTKEEDRREYYENLGKWDQFVYGWDDFMSPQSYATLPGNESYTPTGDPKIDFANPWVSANRETYRLMRDESNDAFKSRDRWLYVNIGLRVFSVVQTAWLDGLLGGGGGDEGDGRLSVAGHDVRLIAQPTGLRRATLAAAVTF